MIDETYFEKYKQLKSLLIDELDKSKNHDEVFRVFDPLFNYYAVRHMELKLDEFHNAGQLLRIYRAFNQGERVSIDGKLYKCIADNNEYAVLCEVENENTDGERISFEKVSIYPNSISRRHEIEKLEIEYIDRTYEMGRL